MLLLLISCSLKTVHVTTKNYIISKWETVDIFPRTTAEAGFLNAVLKVYNICKVQCFLTEQKAA